MALEEIDVRLEVVTLPHLDGVEMIVVLLGLLARDVLSEERFDYLLEITKSEAAKSKTKPMPHLSNWRER